MVDKNGSEDASRPPEEEEEQVEETRRVRPLFRFGRRNNNKEADKEADKEAHQETDEEAHQETDKEAHQEADEEAHQETDKEAHQETDKEAHQETDEEAHQETDEEAHARVRPVRVVKFIPFGNKGSTEEPEEEEGKAPFAAVEEEGEAPFDVQEVAPVPEAEVTDEASPFLFEEDVPLTEGEEAPFDVQEEAPVPEAEVVDEASPFLFEEDVPLTEGEEVPFDAQEEAPFAAVVEEEAPFAGEETTPAAPAVPFGTIEEMEREEPVRDSVSIQEQAETEEEFQFRQEETLATLETREGVGASAEANAPVVEEVKPHYHKFLKPDEELLQMKQAKGRATGFDRDMDADAGEIDFGIDLIDPSDRKKKAPPRKEPETGPKKGVGGHDFDSEVVTQQTGMDIGVDYQKRRKRRL